ncbi:VirK/YbjX family protein [Zophobihabitans entericus]|uniref:DUF535 domain-containing protein n=1 Tax=Zophobihabitans entericus TaxID=1635327 RepID=A0A6G9ICC8_9GAMM|nr:VirK/YbjX family protein [Zophobihabitans entericus]QIQ21885.1 DUF535 domain-containing protein [Zophobihabitans entericus]
MNNIKAMPLPTSRKDLFNRLVKGELILNPLWEKPLYRKKFLLRSYFAYPKTLTWLDHLYQYHLLPYYLSRQTNLPCKLQRPYLSSCISQKEALDALIFHYDFLEQQPDAVTQAFYDDQPYRLADITGKAEATFYVELQSTDKFSREGELTLSIFNQDNISLANLTFSIISYQNKPTLFIAGLQGANVVDSRQVIQQATKACFGLFPKRLVIEVAQLIASHFSLQQIIAVSNSTHIYNNWRYRRRHKHVHSDYDEFWLTLDGQQDKRQLFVLPLVTQRKALEDIASKKRSEYRSRYALLDALAENVSGQLSTLK